MATIKNPDVNRDVGDTNRELSASGNYDDVANGRGSRAQDVAGRQTYGTTGSLAGSSTTQRDFYREALARSTSRGESWRSGREGREEYRPVDRREDSSVQGYGQVPGRYAETQGRTEGWRDVGGQRERGEGFRGQESYRAGPGPEVYRGEEWQGQQGPRHEGGHTGRTVALAAAGLGAAGVGLGLLRRGRWAKEPLVASEVMSRGVKTVLPEHTLHEVARLMREENVGIVPVTDAVGRLLGVVTDRDLVVRAMSEDRLPSKVRVADIMSSDDLEVVTPDESVHEVIELMGKKQVRRIPVVERDNRLVGIIAMSDIATRAEFDEELQEALERISSRRSFWSRLG